ncbi:glycerate kinase [Rhodoferax sp. WC2427]|uniref:glycerate kinase n=1 Tax=Rhodoferax sp. WC2427 TaxID=3234144 RepID=UPI0034674E8D
MQFQKILVPVGVVAVVVVAFREYSWAGVALALGLVVMWGLLHFSRMMQVMTRAANRPIGTVASAVMLNAKLRPGVTLLHVVAMTKSLGALQTPKDTQPELYRWTDASASFVTCTFAGGKLVEWQLLRPPQDDGEPPAAAPGAA